MKKALGLTESFPATEDDKTRKLYVTESGFPIVGIGASAGGLEALQSFLQNVPEKSGIAYILVQHLDPTHKGYLVDILNRETDMPVLQVTEGTAIEPNCVYIIPPNKDMSLFHGVLYLFEPVKSNGLRLPIDFLFRSLADDLKQQAIGVILSGMGSDGTLGLKAIKESGGTIFVQDPVQAKFNGMPQSAIETGLADIVLPVEELPLRIIAHHKNKSFIAKSEPDLVDKDRNSFEKIINLLRLATGHDFSLYKQTTVYRRIERRLGVHQIVDLAIYIRFIQENPSELQVLFKELLIGVTNFFRDAQAWETLKEKIFPNLLSTNAQNPALRAWVTGCSTGEEAYSLAIIFIEALELAKPQGNFSLQIFATDIDQDAIEKARQGFYPDTITADISPERLDRFFTKKANGYQIRNDIRNMIIFATQNAIMDPPFTKIDILSCRNLFIYMTAELQKTLLTLFHHSLNPDGVLFLGSAETIGNLTDLYKPMEEKTRFYRRLAANTANGLFQIAPLRLSYSLDNMKADIKQTKTQMHVTNLEEAANQFIMQRYAPAAVLVNNKGDILYTSGPIGKYLAPAAGKANWNIFVMAREGLRYNLSKSFQEAVHQDKSITLKNIMIIDTNNDEKMATDVAIQPFAAPAALQNLVMIVFTDVNLPVKTKGTHQTKLSHNSGDRVVELELDLENSHLELQNLRREMKSSEEELVTAYEELQSTNEELQSINEEITTSKEELQSLNEELLTVNYELQTKIDELSFANNDLKNLLESTDIATLFLDKALCVRRFTEQTTKIIKLIPGDVGRPITDIVTDLCYPELVEDAWEVLRKLTFIEKSVATSDNRWFMVRIMPYRTMEDKIDGIVITFSDITTAKILEASLRQQQGVLEKQIISKDKKINRDKKEKASHPQSQQRTKLNDT